MCVTLCENLISLVFKLPANPNPTKMRRLLKGLTSPKNQACIVKNDYFHL